MTVRCEFLPKSEGELERTTAGFIKRLRCVGGSPVACVAVTGKGAAVGVVLRLQGRDMRVERC